MSKPIKYVVIAAAALIALLVAAAGIIAATFNPNDYKPLIIRMVQEKKQRTLEIPGEIRLTFFPTIGADLGKVSISERNSTREFASIDSARVALQLIPLLSKQLVVDQVRVDSMRVNIRRFKDGTTNFDDLLSKGGPDGQQIGFDVDDVDITNANIMFDDQQRGRRFEIWKLNLETGKIASGVPSKAKLSALLRSDTPYVDARIILKTGFTIDLDRKRFVVKGADADIKGRLLDFTDITLKAQGDADLEPNDKRYAIDGIKVTASGKRAARALEMKLDLPKLAITETQVAGGKLSGDAKLSEGARTMTVNLSAPSFEGSPQAFRLPSLSLDATAKDAKLDAKAKITGAISGNLDKMAFASPQLKLVLSGKQAGTTIDGSLSTPFSFDLKTQLIELSDIEGAFNLPNPGGMMKINAAGRARADFGKETMSASLKGTLDESAFDARLGMSRFSPAAYTFDIGIDRIDADRYKSKSAASSTKTEKTDKPLDLSALRELDASGSLRIGALKVENIKASNVRVGVHAAGGKVDLNPLAANLYGGSVSGSLSATTGSVPHVAVRQTLAGIDIGPLMKDAIDKQPIEGRGNVRLDLAAQGTTIAQMKKSLDGTARLELRDGAIHGINVAQAIRSAKAKVGAIKAGEAPQSGTASASEKTDFSEMSGTFRIANGVAHNDDLSVKSPLIRIGGTGDINLGEDRLDYLARAAIVSTLQGQGGPELQALKGLTVPVRLTGPFSAMDWHIDFQGMASELAKQKLDEKKAEVRSRAQKEVDQQKSQAQERIKEGLKGLFGK